MDRAIYAVDELAGFITAVALVRPNKSIHEVEVSPVKKKMKDKGFACTVNRDDITGGAEVLGVDWMNTSPSSSNHWKPVAGDLGIAGTA